MAHSRRRRENDTFNEMAEALPIQENAKDLDKASILRVAIHYLKLRNVVGEKDAAAEDSGESEGSGTPEEPADRDVTVKKEELDDGSVQGNEEDDYKPSTSLPNFAKDVLQALDGFMLVISSDGRILYTSDTISTYLGLRQVDVIGIPIKDIIHPQDISELATIFNTQGKDTEQVFDRNDPLKRNFVVRMRCAFTPSVRSITRCSNFKPIYCSASLKFGKTEQTRGVFQGLVALCKLASVSRIREMCVGAFFKTKHSLDLGYIGIDTRIRWILGYDPTEMMGHKAYQYFHPQDLTATSSCHMNLLSQGQSHSPCYRFMSRWGDWLWVRSKSYVTYNPISHMPDGLLIYTWIVRLEEEDDRMKAIQDGKSAVEKTYTDLDSTISTEGGSLDIGKLTDPNTPSAASEPEEPVVPTPPMPRKPVRLIQRSESGYMSFPSPLNTHALPSPPLTAVTTPPDSVTYATTNSACGSPPNSCQSSLNASQTSLFGGAPGVQHTSMPSPPYTPYDNSPPPQSQQFVDPYITGTGFQDYQGFPQNSMAAASTGYLPQQQQQQQQQQPLMGYGSGQYMQPTYTASIPTSLGGVSMQNQFPTCSINQPTFEMQATVFSASPTSSTLCYQPTNLTDLQFPLESRVPSSYNVTPVSSTSNPVDKRYVNDARVRYNRVACAAPGVHAGTKRARETPPTQPRSIADWSSPQWMQGAPAPHVY